jgi:hypothetical protein
MSVTPIAKNSHAANKLDHCLWPDRLLKASFTKHKAKKLRRCFGTFLSDNGSTANRPMPSELTASPVLHRLISLSRSFQPARHFRRSSAASVVIP